MKTYRVSVHGWIIVAALLVGDVASSLAGYVVKSQVQTTAEGNHYTWTVLNQDQSWGLDGFVIAVPVETRVLGQTVPPPHSNPDGSAYWIIYETPDAQVAPHDGKAWLPAAEAGKKWIIWWGHQSPSVYPPGTTATFTLQTDASVMPGSVDSTATTYTPQNNPNYYFPFRGRVIGPARLATPATNSEGSTPGTQAAESLFQPEGATVPGVTTTSNHTPDEVSLSIAFYAGVTIRGIMGATYGIQYSPDLSDPAGWRGLANVTLIGPDQIWFDPESPTRPQGYYRIVRGPTSIP